MDGAQRIKIALDETRTLVLGAQVLFGFQLRAAFQDGFDQLPAVSRALDGVALLLMTLVVGLLVAPAIHHRTVYGGEAVAQMSRIVSRHMEFALIPFALSLGINCFIVGERMATAGWAAFAAMVAVATALWFWFGLALWALRQKGRKTVTPKDEHVPLTKKIEQMLTEARVILPGAQALLGFQFLVVLAHNFDRLPLPSRALHGAALVLVALSTVLLMAPAAYHRIVYDGEASEQILGVGNHFLIAATVALALGLSADVYVIIAKISESAIAGLAAALLSVTLLIGLWHVAPLLRRGQASSSTVHRALQKHQLPM